MKALLFNLTICLLALSSLNACKKADDSTVQKPMNNAPMATTPADAYGLFSAQRVITKEDFYTNYNVCSGGVGTDQVIKNNSYGTTAITGTASALCMAQANGLAGIQCNDSSLHVLGCAFASYSLNAYVFVPSPSDPGGIPFQGQAYWQINDSAIATPNYSFADSTIFPAIDDIYTTGDVATNSSFTLLATGPVTGDSVIFIIVGPKGSLRKVAGPNSAAQIFSAAEMATVGTTTGLTGLLQIAPYRQIQKSINGKTLYFIKETCLSKYVNLK